MSDASPSVASLSNLPARAEPGTAAPNQAAGAPAVLQLTAAALDCISEGFIVLDRDWRFVFVNPAAERIMQKSGAEVLGHSLWERFPDAAHRRFGIEYRRAVAENVPVEFEEFYPEPLNAWFEVRAYPSRDALSVFFRDITARRGAREALRQSEERYRSLFNSMGQGFALFENICDETGAPLESRFVDVNPAFERLIGLKRDDVVGRRGRDVFPADFAQWGEMYRRVVLTGQPVAVSHTLSSTNRHFEVFAFQPSPRHFAVLFHDVTDNRMLEEALRERAKELRCLYGIADLTSGSGRLEGLLQGAVELMPQGWLHTDIACARITLDGREFKTPGFRETTWRQASEIVLDGRPAGLVELCYLDERPVRDEGPFLKEERDLIDEIARRLARMAEHKRLEEALRVNLTKYTVLFESFPLGISVTDSAGKILEINAAARRLLGVPDEQVVGQRVGVPQWRIIRPDGSPMPPEEFASVRAFSEKAVVEDVEVGIARPGEDVIWLSTSAAPIPLDEYGVVITYGDISRRRRAEEKLQAAHRETAAAKARLEAAMEALPTGLTILDANGRNVRSNAAFEAIWGPGRPATTSVADYHKYKARWADTGRDVLPEEWASSRAILRGETVVGQLLEVERFDRGRAFILNSAAPILDEDGKIQGCAVAAQDISRLVHAERELAHSEAALRGANAELNSANDALRQSNETLEARVVARTEDLSRRTSQLQALALDLTRAEERERQRVAEVIHDHLQQLLSVARINLAMVLERVKAKSVQKSLADLDGLLAESLDITRSLTADLSPAILHRSGLAAALRWLGRWYQGRFGLEVEVEIEEDPDLDGEARATLFRAVRELLFNVVKHAGVAGAKVQLGRTADGRARIVVSDEGAGFDPKVLRAWDGSAGGFGLFSLHERLDLLGGHLEVNSAEGRGATFTITGAPPRPAPAATPPVPAVAPLKIAVRRGAGARPGRPSCAKPPGKR